MLIHTIHDSFSPGQICGDLVSSFERAVGEIGHDATVWMTSSYRRPEAMSLSTRGSASVGWTQAPLLLQEALFSTLVPITGGMGFALLTQTLPRLALYFPEARIAALVGGFAASAAYTFLQTQASGRMNTPAAIAYACATAALACVPALGGEVLGPFHGLIANTLFQTAAFSFLSLGLDLALSKHRPSNDELVGQWKTNLVMGLGMAMVFHGIGIGSSVGTRRPLQQASLQDPRMTANKGGNTLEGISLSGIDDQDLPGGAGTFEKGGIPGSGNEAVPSFPFHEISDIIRAINARVPDLKVNRGSLMRESDGVYAFNGTCEGQTVVGGYIPTMDQLFFEHQSPRQGTVQELVSRELGRWRYFEVSPDFVGEVRTVSGLKIVRMPSQSHVFLRILECPGNHLFKLAKLEDGVSLCFTLRRDVSVTRHTPTGDVRVGGRAGSLEKKVSIFVKHWDQDHWASMNHIRFQGFHVQAPDAPRLRLQDLQGEGTSLRKWSVVSRKIEFSHPVVAAQKILSDGRRLTAIYESEPGKPLHPLPHGVEFFEIAPSGVRLIRMSGSESGWRLTTSQGIFQAEQLRYSPNVDGLEAVLTDGRNVVVNLDTTTFSKNHPLSRSATIHAHYDPQAVENMIYVGDLKQLAVETHPLTNDRSLYIARRATPASRWQTQIAILGRERALGRLAIADRVPLHCKINEGVQIYSDTTQKLFVRYCECVFRDLPLRVTFDTSGQCRFSFSFAKGRFSPRIIDCQTPLVSGKSCTLNVVENTSDHLNIALRGTVLDGTRERIDRMIIEHPSSPETVRIGLYAGGELKRLIAPQFAEITKRGQIFELKVADCIAQSSWRPRYAHIKAENGLELVASKAECAFAIPSQVPFGVKKRGDMYEIVSKTAFSETTVARLSEGQRQPFMFTRDGNIARSNIARLKFNQSAIEHPTSDIVFSVRDGVVWIDLPRHPQLAFRYAPHVRETYAMLQWRPSEDLAGLIRKRLVPTHTAMPAAVAKFLPFLRPA